MAIYFLQLYFYLNDAFNNSNLLEVKDYIDEKTFDISSLDSYSRLTISIGKLNGKFNIDVFIESSQPFTTDDASLTLYYNINVVGGYHTIVNKKFDVNENVCKVSIKASEFKDVDIDSADITSSEIIIQCVNKNGIERNFTIEKNTIIWRCCIYNYS